MRDSSSNCMARYSALCRSTMGADENRICANQIISSQPRPSTLSHHRDASFRSVLSFGLRPTKVLFALVLLAGRFEWRFNGPVSSRARSKLVNYLLNGTADSLSHSFYLILLSQFDGEFQPRKRISLQKWTFHLPQIKSG